METRLEQIGARIGVHAQRLPILIDHGAPSIIIGHELLILERLCGSYTREYLGGIVLANLLLRYCKGYKQPNKGTINGYYPPST